MAAVGAGLEDGDVDTKRTFSTKRMATDSKGQSLIELMVGLVALIVLIAGIVQVAGLTRIQTDALVEARREVGNRVFLDAPVSELPDFIEDITAGQDQRTYSSDDVRTSADPTAFRSTIAARAAGGASEWSVLNSLPSSPFSDLYNASTPVTEFGLLQGDASASVATIPAVQSLLYDSPEIEINCEVWMTWTKGIY